MRRSLTSVERSVIFVSSRSTATTATGSMLGFNFKIVGVPTIESHEPLMRFNFSRMSPVIVSMFVSCENSSITSE